jgi:hypothetical protein
MPSEAERSERPLTYSEVMAGEDNPDAMWMNGHTLKNHFRPDGVELLEDAEGFPIDDRRIYVVTKKGIFRW